MIANIAYDRMYIYATYLMRSHKTRSTRDRSIPQYKGHIKPVVRAIEVSHAAYENEVRRNPRSQAILALCSIAHSAGF